MASGQVLVSLHFLYRPSVVPEIGSKRLVGEREQAFEIELFLAIAVGALGLRPPVVHVEAVAGRDPLHHAVENLLVALVLVETEMDEVVECPAGLRRRFGVDPVTSPCERIGRIDIVCFE